MPFIRLIFGFLKSRWTWFAGVVAAAGTKLTALRALSWIAKAAALAALILLIPLPTWLTELPGRLSALPSGLVWLLGLVEAKKGIAIVIGAMVTRFTFRMMIEAMRS